MDELKAFLSLHYRHDRFAGRDGRDWGFDYSDCVTESARISLVKNGKSCISRHESKTGEAVWFNEKLELIV